MNSTYNQSRTWAFDLVIPNMLDELERMVKVDHKGSFAMDEIILMVINHAESRGNVSFNAICNMYRAAKREKEGCAAKYLKLIER